MEAIEAKITEHIKELERQMANLRIELDHWKGVLTDTSRKLKLKRVRQVAAENGKAALVREMLQKSGSEGITPAEIRRAAAERGHNLVAAYPYTQLRKMLDQKKVKKSGGRYYLAS